MKQKPAPTLFSIIMFTAMLTFALNIPSVKASPDTITINPDGSITPSSAPISTIDNVTYTFTANINDAIIIQRNNTTIDGSSHTLYGSGVTESFGIKIEYTAQNVTIQHINIQDFTVGIKINSTSHNKILQNNITATAIRGIEILKATNNTISQNNITNNTGVAIFTNMMFFTKFTENNITNNTGGIHIIYSSFNDVSRNNIASNDQYGVSLDNSFNNTVTENNINANGFYGIFVRASNYNNIYGNNIKSIDDGVDVYLDSKFNTILENTITNNGEHGVSISLSSNNNTVSRNNITDNGYLGIYIESSYNNTVSRNNIANNVEYGIELSGASKNTFYHNNIINNTKQVYIPTPSYPNTWDNGYDGNYWSNYTGTDLDNDGIGNAPHLLDPDNQDNCPLIYPLSFFNAGTYNGKTYVVHISSNSTLSDFAVDIDNPRYSISFDVNSTTGTQGLCRIAIPTEFMWCSNIDDWAVKVGDNITQRTVIPTQEGYTYIYFTYTHSTRTVQITSTDGVPEFPSVGVIITLLMMVTLLGVLVCRRKPKNIKNGTDDILIDAR